MSETIDNPTCPLCNEEITPGQDSILMGGAESDSLVHDECCNQIEAEAALRDGFKDALRDIKEALDEYANRKGCNREAQTPKTKHAVAKIRSIIWLEDLDNIL